MQRVLSVGFSRAAMQQRNAVLSAAGLTALEAAGVARALELIADENIDVLVLGSALPTEARNGVALAARRQSPDIRIIMLYDGRIVNAELTDAIIGDDDPQQVLETIRVFAADRNGDFKFA